MAIKKCNICGYEGKEVSITKGSIWLECGLWLLTLLTFGVFILAAFPYSLWRVCSRYKGCPNCHNPHMFKIPNKK